MSPLVLAALAGLGALLLLGKKKTAAVPEPPPPPTARQPMPPPPPEPTAPPTVVEQGQARAKTTIPVETPEGIQPITQTNTFVWRDYSDGSTEIRVSDPVYGNAWAKFRDGKLIDSGFSGRMYGPTDERYKSSRVMLERVLAVASFEKAFDRPVAPGVVQKA